MTASETAYPIRTLREHVAALEAAMMICLASPKPRAVHRLRTTTRRIEGQLALLGMVPAIPMHDEQKTMKTRRNLKKMRRAAGGVRDLDVQQDLIGSVESTSRSKSLQHDAAQLRAHIEEMRKEHAASLQTLLRRRAAELTGSLEELLDALDPAESAALTPAEIATLARDWFQRNVPAAPTDSADNPDYLHAIRKTAKLARYIAENAPKGASVARELARSFEELQQAGGEWHDWLVLAALADKRLGASSQLTTVFAQRCHLSLEAYKKLLSGAIA